MIMMHEKKEGRIGQFGGTRQMFCERSPSGRWILCIRNWFVYGHMKAIQVVYGFKILPYRWSVELVSFPFALTMDIEPPDAVVECGVCSLCVACLVGAKAIPPVFSVISIIKFVISIMGSIYHQFAIRGHDEPKLVLFSGFFLGYHKIGFRFIKLYHPVKLVGCIEVAFGFWISFGMLGCVQRSRCQRRRTNVGGRVFRSTICTDFN